VFLLAIVCSFLVPFYCCCAAIRCALNWSLPQARDQQLVRRASCVPKPARFLIRLEPRLAASV